jgi:hypothetical protein
MLEWVIHAYHCVSRGSQALVGMYRPTRELMYEHVSTWNICLDTRIDVLPTYMLKDRLVEGKT